MTDTTLPEIVQHAIDTAREELDATAAALTGLKGGIREAVLLWVETGRVTEADAQATLRQLGIEELVRNRYTVRIPVTGTFAIGVIGEDEDDALARAIDIANRLCQSLVYDASVQSLRVNRAAPVQITRN